jgi:hypothetical protein
MLRIALLHCHAKVTDGFGEHLIPIARQGFNINAASRDRPEAAALKGEGRGHEDQGQRTDWASTLGVHTSTPKGKLKCGRSQA